MVRCNDGSYFLDQHTHCHLNHIQTIMEIRSEDRERGTRGARMDSVYRTAFPVRSTDRNAMANNVRSEIQIR